MKRIFTLVSLFFFGFINAQTLNIQSFATGFSNPVAIEHPKDDPRLFVVQKGGLIRIVNPDGTVNATPFLTVTGLAPGNEQGLLGLAFHPNYANNGIFFINYVNSSGNTVIAKYTVSSNPNVANPTGTTIMTINQPYSNHNGGSLVFGPDGYLYIGMGDGGSGGDPDGYAQNMTVNSSFPSRVFLGKMLRIDVDSGTNYAIPPTNPFVGQAGKEEIWALGLRNPWKYSFNRLNGDLWIADVGQNQIEEINKIASPLPNTGINFGWKCYEGNNTFSTAGCQAASNYTFPVVQYARSGVRCSVTGGYVYTGSLYPNLQNKYVFADYCSAEIAFLDENNVITWSFNAPGSLTSFGEDMNGELYAAIDGTIHKIIDTSLSINEVNKSKLSIYPNPATNEISIVNTGNLEIKNLRITDLTGKIVLQENVENYSNPISISSLAKGVYVVFIENSSEEIFTSKLVKQ